MESPFRDDSWNFDPDDNTPPPKEPYMDGLAAGILIFAAVFVSVWVAISYGLYVNDGGGMASGIIDLFGLLAACILMGAFFTVFACIVIGFAGACFVQMSV